MNWPHLPALLDRYWPPVLSGITRFGIEPAIGSPYLTVARKLHGFWSWDADRRHEWQRSRLDEMIGHARTSVPFYTSLPASFRQLTDLPVVDKAAIRTDTESFRAHGRYRSITKRTGGSTGDPWIYQLDRQAWAQMFGAQLYRFEELGHRYGERRLHLGAPNSLGLLDTSMQKRIRTRLERQVTGYTGLAIDQPASILRAVRATDADIPFWYGYASTVAAVACAVVENELPVEGPRTVVTMAEKLQPEWRRYIELAFPFSVVVEEYGCNDGGVLAHSCAAGNLHLADNLSVVEILDGERRCQEGEEGLVTVTNLHARAMPFLRYQTGDRAVLGPDPCPCGQPGSTLAWIQGRTGDRVRLAGGEEFGPSAFTHPFKVTPDVRRWQVIQTSPDHLEIRLDVSDGFDTDQRSAITSYLDRTLGADVVVDLRTDRPILRTAGGKHRVIVATADVEPDTVSSHKEPHHADHHSPRQG